jgi:hypothetical protein
MISASIPVLAKLIYHTDNEILMDACWALSYISDGSEKQIEAVVNAGVIRRMVELLSHPLNNVVTPALRTIGNIVTGDDAQTQVVINCGILPQLLHLLKSSKRNIRKEACW